MGLSTDCLNQCWLLQWVLCWALGHLLHPGGKGQAWLWAGSFYACHSFGCVTVVPST